MSPVVSFSVMATNITVSPIDSSSVDVSSVEAASMSIHGSSRTDVSESVYFAHVSVGESTVTNRVGVGSGVGMSDRVANVANVAIAERRIVAHFKTIFDNVGRI